MMSITKNAGVKVRKHEIYVYGFNGVNLTFQKCNTIADAIRLSVSIPGSYVICDGQIVNFNILSNGKVTYMRSDGRTQEIDIIRYR